MRCLFAIALVLSIAGAFVRPVRADALADQRAGTAAFQRGNYAEAVKLYSRALDQPDNAFNPKLTRTRLANLFYDRANAYQKLRRNREAVADYRRALALLPDFYQAHYNMGNAYAKLGNRQASIDAYSAAIRINPNYVRPYINRGNRYAEAKQYRRALTDYNRAIEINPKLAIAWYNRGYIHEHLKQRSSAIRDYRRALQIQPSYERARKALQRLGAL